MNTSDILTLIGLVAGGVASLCGVVAWFHVYMSDQKEKFRTELKEAVDEEAKTRKEEIARIESQVKAVSDLALTVGLMGKSIEHLTERFADNQATLGEVKAALKSIDSRMNQMAIDAAKRVRTPRPAKKKATANDRVNAAD